MEKTKREMTVEAFRALGLSASNKEITDWVKEKYNVPILHGNIANYRKLFKLGKYGDKPFSATEETAEKVKPPVPKKRKRRAPPTQGTVKPMPAAAKETEAPGGRPVPGLLSGSGTIHFCPGCGLNLDVIAHALAIAEGVRHGG